MNSSRVIEIYQNTEINKALAHDFIVISKISNIYLVIYLKQLVNPIIRCPFYVFSIHFN